MLYEIREEDGKSKLYLSKKSGFKFKKTFSSFEDAQSFIERYLRNCCLACLERGWVYKTRGSGGINGGGARHGKGNRGLPRWGKPPAGRIVLCPECHSKHKIQYAERQIVLTLHQE